MKKNTRKAMIIILILLFVVLLCLSGLIYLQQNQKKQADQIKELKKEIQVLEEKQAKLVSDREELLAGPDARENQETDESQEETQTLSDEESQSLAGMDAVQESVLANVSQRMDAGENWQVYVCRLSDHAEEAVGSGRMTAASLIKLYIMGAVYENYEAITGRNGKEKVDRLLKAMITVSDNDAANTLTVMLGQGDAAAGRAAVNDYCVRNGYTDSDMGRMLLETGTDRENYTSVKDCGAFLERICQGEILYGEDMMNLLKQQERRSKIPAGVPEGVTVANKTGELEHVENDAAVVFKDNCPYILCVMSENVGDTSAARNVIVSISSGVYDSIAQ